MRVLSHDTRYGFAIGRLRALETRLLDRQQWDRLVRAGDAVEFRALLADTEYLRAARPEGGAGEPEPGDAFAAAAVENFSFLARYCRDAWVLDIFRLRADAHNLKLTVKTALAGPAGPASGAARLGYGRWSEEQLAALAEARPRAKPEGFRAAIASARARWESGPDPAFLDAAVDRAAQAEVVEAVRGNWFLAGYFARAADVQNLRALVRLKLLGEDRAALEAVLLPGGNIRPDRFPRLLDEDWDGIANAFRRGEYERMVEQGIGGITAGAGGPGSRAEGAGEGREYSLPSGGPPARSAGAGGPGEKERPASPSGGFPAQSAGSLLRFERLGRELELAWLARARYLTFGFEPLVSFFLFRENEILSLQRLLAAKNAGLDEADCAELVAYV